MNFNKKSRSTIKNSIITQNLIPYHCSECNISEWNGKPISLHLDHINGINNDNRLENLRFLCPNCHSQTETYCGKNNKNGFNQSKKKVSDEELIESMRNSKTISESLTKVGLAGAGNYNRVKRLATENDIHHILELTTRNRSRVENLPEKISALRESGIDFQAWGAMVKAGAIIGISPQKARKFILRHAPDLL